MCNKVNCNCCNECDNTCNDPCEEQVCGCPIELDSACIRLNREFECIGTSKGQTVEQALEKIDERLCNINDGVDGEDCDCNDAVLYMHEHDTRDVDYGEGGEIGLWVDVNSVSTPASVPLATSSYTVPPGGDGTYEILLETHVQNKADGGGGAGDVCSYQIGFYKNGVRLYYTACAVLAYSAPHGSMTLFVSDIPLVAGDVTDIRVSASNAGVDARFIDTHYKMVKLT